MADNDKESADLQSDDLAKLFGETADLEPTTGFVDAVMARAHASESASLDPEQRLAQLFEATAELQPSASFQVALPDVSAPLRGTSDAAHVETLFAKTEGLAPSDGFTDAVMGRIAKIAPVAKPGLLEGLGRKGRTAFFAAAAVAAASIGFSFYSESSYDAGVMASADFEGRW